MTTQSFLDEAYSEGTGEAYLDLLTIEDPGLPSPLRFTSDGVETISNGEVYASLGFQAVRPDKAQGRQPQARLRLDNTNEALIAALRGLQTRPTVTWTLIRASDPDVAEETYSGMRLVDVSAGPGFIDLVLGVEDLDGARFPPRVFDASWQGVWKT